MTSFISVSVLSEDECVCCFLSSKVPKDNPLVSIDSKEVTGDWNNSFYNNHPSTVWISFSMLCFFVYFWSFFFLQNVDIEVKEGFLSI